MSVDSQELLKEKENEHSINHVNKTAQQYGGEYTLPNKEYNTITLISFGNFAEVLGPRMRPRSHVGLQCPTSYKNDVCFNHIVQII